MREEDVPAQHPEAEEEARLPAPHADARRARGAAAPSLEGPRSPVRLIWRVTDRASFRALASGRRRRRGALTVSCVAVAGNGPPRVAYAVGRGAGGAVARNRLRRRLRAAVQAERAALAGGHAYLVGAGARAHDLTLSEMRETLRAILTELHGEERA